MCTPSSRASGAPSSIPAGPPARPQSPGRGRRLRRRAPGSGPVAAQRARGRRDRGRVRDHRAPALDGTGAGPRRRPEKRRRTRRAAVSAPAASLMTSPGTCPKLAWIATRAGNKPPSVFAKVSAISRPRVSFHDSAAASGTGVALSVMKQNLLLRRWPVPPQLRRMSMSLVWIENDNTSRRNGSGDLRHLASANSSQGDYD